MRRAHIYLSGAFALVLGAVLLVPAVRVAAHAAYDHSTPAKDEVVATQPAQVDAYFKQNIFRQTGAFYLRVFADDNTTQVSQGDGTHDDNDRHHMFAALPPGLPNGRYIVHWATRSDEDGEDDEGMYCFHVGVQPTAAQQAECASFAPTPVPTIASTQQPTSVPTTSAVTPSPTSDDTPTPKGGGSNTGAIIGIVVGVVAAVVVVGGAGLWWRSRRT